MSASVAAWNDLVVLTSYLKFTYIPPFFISCIFCGIDFLESALNILSIKASLIIVSMIWNSYWIEISL